GLDLIRKVGGPAPVEATRTGRTGVVADLLLDARFAENRVNLPQIEAENIGVVHARVDGDRASVLHVPPRRDRNAIAAGDVRLDHHAWLADGAIPKQRAGEAI